MTPIICFQCVSVLRPREHDAGMRKHVCRRSLFFCSVVRRPSRRHGASLVSSMIAPLVSSMNTASGGSMQWFVPIICLCGKVSPASGLVFF